MLSADEFSSGADYVTRVVFLLLWSLAVYSHPLHSSPSTPLIFLVIYWLHIIQVGVLKTSWNPCVRACAKEDAWKRVSCSFSRNKAFQSFWKSFWGGRKQVRPANSPFISCSRRSGSTEVQPLGWKHVFALAGTDFATFLIFALGLFQPDFFFLNFIVQTQRSIWRSFFFHLM